ncbi:phosphoribosylformylglycinamidine synthase [Candidatus Desantisbacteria bacterium CG2_30_40_21]|uniref:Phosphoribosylformylglycinamidine synthase subunit PurS n=4 Tax=unclassified Candidatus Desantisiibacteriota TaxID=3106372 RepID=A0A2M7P4S8_9BACT|nr:MAG: phosphoribosylformylglycinamidine synthase [Candidatus Desantisbacteria bacterium CG2_30_40_21]PIP40349.1 MAG: phosphoribosylformylglycinamidine synthase [Candidatus Desantisbacteria bacterium CG23_combo_of_CG06-09_8_20_14_all_40_23]PIY20308.1 MAG: phosphoribosylformylglycinamidine synthase [Candidatus Desantisbacteria bacterium CG_4_10_14_3_um_filter_40_18]PJB28101.1 MAG: phosphoribosylformylglycinamidine synthase [Candidatus Desantisbacteria bacterium CG_4_9_14_3_um_filter_40_11]
MKTIKVVVTLKQGILDPQGLAIKHAMESIDCEGIENVRVGKYIELKFSNDIPEERLNQICEQLLSNPVIEDYRIETGG